MVNDSLASHCNTLGTGSLPASAIRRVLAVRGSCLCESVAWCCVARLETRRASGAEERSNRIVRLLVTGRWRWMSDIHSRIVRSLVEEENSDTYSPVVIRIQSRQRRVIYSSTAVCSRSRAKDVDNMQSSFAVVCPCVEKRGKEEDFGSVSHTFRFFVARADK